MKLGIDFGTTHTVAAVVDRGNYPIVGFDWGDAVPAAFAVRAGDGAVCYGQEAAAEADDPAWTVVRSLKRLLREAGPLTEVRIAERSFGLADLLAGYFTQLRQDIVSVSNADVGAGEPLEVAVSVPANASNDQRFLTLDAFRRAGFDVVTLLNEPSAAGFEYGHRFRRTVTSRREYVLVYDLGGGTFDASLIHMAGLVNEVVASAGVARLGGDDFDAEILELVLQRAKVENVDAPTRRALLETCRDQKERLAPQSRRFVTDLTLLKKAPLVLSIDEIGEACRPLVQRTLDAIDDCMHNPRRAEADQVGLQELAGIYVVGGGSNFPLVGRLLRERFPQRVKRSQHPFAATAIGLACYLDEEAGYELSDCLARHFGVWREAASGREVTFDAIFERDTRLPGPGDPPLSVSRRYRPAHNVGHFRFVECGSLREGRPDGDVVPWNGIRFPYEPSLRDNHDLEAVPVERLESDGTEFEERYECSGSGTFEVTLTSLDDGYSRSFKIAREGEPLTAEP